MGLAKKVARVSALQIKTYQMMRVNLAQIEVVTLPTGEVRTNVTLRMDVAREVRVICSH